MDERPDLGGMKSLREGDGAARVQRRDDRAPCIAMEDRGDREDHVVGYQVQRFDELRSAGAGATVVEENPLWIAGRTGRVEEGGEVVGLQVDCGVGLGALSEQVIEYGHRGGRAGLKPAATAGVED